MGVDIVQHLQISFDEYMQNAKGPVEEATDALIGVLRQENAKKLWDTMASGDFENRELIELLLPIWRNDPAECERRLRQMGESARDAYLETARRKLGWRTGFKISGAVQISDAEKLNLGSDTKHQMLQISVSEKLLSRLPAAVSRAALLSDWDVGEASSPDADGYLAEACNCFLYGLDTACVVMCRALLEEVLEKKLPTSFLTANASKKRQKGWQLIPLIRAIEADPLRSGLSGDVCDILTRVNEAGNTAVHQATAGKDVALMCLVNTRTVLLRVL